MTSEKEELHRLRKEVARLKMERDILKKATVFFAKESLRCFTIAHVSTLQLDIKVQMLLNMFLLYL